MSVEFIFWYWIRVTKCTFLTYTYICIEYMLPTFWGIHVSWRSSVHPSGAGLGNVHFVTYIFVSDICGQNLGDICQLEVFCAPFGRRVRECIFFCNVYIGYMLPTFGEQMSVDFVHCPRAQLSGGPNSPLFQGGQLGPGAQLSGAQLSGAQLSGAQLSGAQFA